MTDKKLQVQIANRFFKIADNLNHGIVWIGRKGQILHINAQFSADLGYEPGEFTPSTIFEVNPYFNMINWRDKWEELCNEGEINLHTQHISAEGIIHPVHIQGVLFDMGEEMVCCGIVQTTHGDNRIRHLLEMTASITHAGSWQYDMVRNDWVFTDEIFKLLNLDIKARKESNLMSLLLPIMNPKEYQLLKEKFDNGTKTGKAFSMEFGVPTLNKNEFKYVRLTAIPEQEGKETLSIYGLIQDISELSKRTADMYLAKQNLEFAQEGMAWLEESGEIVYTNRAYKKLSGYKEEDNPKLNIYNVNPHLSVDDWQAMWADIKVNKNLVFETFHSNCEGESIPVEIYANHSVFEGKEYVCASLRDMRERQQKTQPQRLAQFTLENNPVSVMWFEKSGQLTYANKAACNLLEYTKEEILEKHIMELSGAYPDIKMWNARWRIMRDEKSTNTYEGENVTKSGRHFPVEVNRHYINHEGKEFICVFVRDISKRKQQDQDLQDTLKETISQSSDLSKEVATLRREMKESGGLSSIITNSDKYLHVLTQIRRVAETEATVLITGETGTGKELLAKAVHELSERSDKAMIKVNAAVIPQNLFESELFGHEKGSFTGAVQAREGRFEAADGGTIFLDEIGEMPIDLQAKLLRVLQEGEFERVGGNKTIKVDVRVVAATNRNLEEMVAEGKFREDLYYRLNVFPVHNLPLRERKEDIPLLIDFFLKKYTRKIGKKVTEVPKKSLRTLMKYEFPGNVRELENMVERALILSSSTQLNLDAVLKSGMLQKKKRTSKFQTLDEMQKEYIIEAIKRCHGRISGKNGAAIILGLNDKTLYSRIKKLGIEKVDYIV